MLCKSISESVRFVNERGVCSVSRLRCLTDDIHNYLEHSDHTTAMHVWLVLFFNELI